MMQQKKPQDFVIATGKQYSIKKFIDMVCAELKLKINWRGSGLNTKGVNKVGKVIIECNKKYFSLQRLRVYWKSNQAKKFLKWKPKTSIKDLLGIL